MAIFSCGNNNGEKQEQIGQLAEIIQNEVQITFSKDNTVQLWLDKSTFQKEGSITSIILHEKNTSMQSNYETGDCVRILMNNEGKWYQTVFAPDATGAAYSLTPGDERELEIYMAYTDRVFVLPSGTYRIVKEYYEITLDNKRIPHVYYTEFTVLG